MEVARSYANLGSMASVLIVGGAGYVGSAVAAHLQDRGEDVWVLDDLSTGHRSFVLDPVVRAGKFVESRAGDRATLDALFSSQRFDTVFHFAAKSLVGESVRLPDLYWENNVEQTRLLLDSVIEAGISRFVFSSTAAVYGDPGDQEIEEDLIKIPINPYGSTKLAVEKMLEDYGRRFGLRSVALRYFNAAGAEAKLRVGEHHNPETHLIPNLLSAGLEGHAVSIFGDDYPTRDGTCIRDYVHVDDLAQAHAAAALRMRSEASGAKGFEAYNLGSSSGYSVKEVIAAAEKILGKPIGKKIEARREGDPVKLVAVSDRARHDLGFSPSADSLDRILASALAWERKKRSIKRAVFLDRDGTLNFDPGYLNDPEKLELLPGVADALRRLSAAGYLLVVVSNQSGVSRGKVTPAQLSRIHEKLDRLLASEGVRIHHYALCLHHPDTDCECRKPKPKLLFEAAARYHIDLSHSYMIGDKSSDVDCGRNAGLADSFLVGTGYGVEEMKTRSDLSAVFVPTLREFADRIISAKI